MSALWTSKLVKGPLEVTTDGLLSPQGVIELTLKIGFTGTQSGLTLPQLSVLTGWLSGLPPWNLEFHHGKCRGADEQAAATAEFLGFTTVAHPPHDPKQESDFVSDEERPRKGYLARNHDIVDECGVLFACPRTQVEPIQKRGEGTWATIRYARKCWARQNGKKLVIIYPDGTEEVLG